MLLKYTQSGTVWNWYTGRDIGKIKQKYLKFQQSIYRLTGYSYVWHIYFDLILAVIFMFDSNTSQSGNCQFHFWCIFSAKYLH